MVIPIPIPRGGGGGYVGPKMDLTGWDMPTLPNGWRWEASDNGGWAGVPFRGFFAFLAGNPCIVWLYPDKGYEFVDNEQEVQRSRSEIKRAANAIVRRSIKRAAIDNRFSAFITEGKS